MGLKTVYPLLIEMNRPVGSFLLHPEKKEQNRRLAGSRCYPEVHPTAYKAFGIDFNLFDLLLVVK